ncbi:hypothetical protein Dimus_025482 [Dionaea muscipula]
MAAKLSDRPPEVPPSAAVASLLATKQLVIDRFIPYISLYSRRCPSVGSFTTAAKSDRTAILKWFSSLSVHHRLSYLTIVDRSFAQLLLRMVAKLRSLGHCTFIILPDVPESPDLPSLCHRRSRGLMARIADSNESERLIRDSIRLFNSNEGEATRDSSSSAHCIDTVTFCEEFARDMDRFVKAMDRVSDSGFLMSDCAEMGADWVEFGWLKAQGYSSMEAIVANRVEVALRSAWLSCNSGKKRGVKLKEKVGRVGVAVNVYWRKKGCVDRWEKLDAAVKRKSLKMVLGKTAKFLPDVTFPLQPPELLNCPTHMASLLLIQNLLHDEIDQFCKQVAAENLIRRPYINWAVKRVTRSLQVLWPRSRTSIFGSYATGLALPTSDVDLVVCLPPVRNLVRAF